MFNGQNLTLTQQFELALVSGKMLPVQSEFELDFEITSNVLGTRTQTIKIEINMEESDKDDDKNSTPRFFFDFR